MANPRGRPNLIRQTGLGDKILALRKSGMTLPQISLLIQDEDKIKLGVNVLSRFLKSNDKLMVTQTDSSDQLIDIIHIFDTLDFYLDKIESISLRERKAMRTRLKSARYTILDKTKNIMKGSGVETVENDKRKVLNFIIALSEWMCPKCRRVITTAMMDKEEIGSFYSKYSKAKQQHIADGDWEDNKKEWEHKKDQIEQFHGIPDYRKRYGN